MGALLLLPLHAPGTRRVARWHANAPYAHAHRFASPKLRFGAFDVCLWPGAAAELRLSSNTWSNVLPSVLLFDKAKEWGRLPPLEAAGDPTKRNAYTRRDIVRLFKLEERFTRPLDPGGAGGSGGKAGGKGRGA